jgi:hypothetical protein
MSGTKIRRMQWEYFHNSESVSSCERCTGQPDEAVLSGWDDNGHTPPPMSAVVFLCVLCQAAKSAFASEGYHYQQNG